MLIASSWTRSSFVGNSWSVRSGADRCACCERRSGSRNGQGHAPFGSFAVASSGEGVRRGSVSQRKLVVVGGAGRCNGSIPATVYGEQLHIRRRDNRSLLSSMFGYVLLLVELVHGSCHAIRACADHCFDWRVLSHHVFQRGSGHGVRRQRCELRLVVGSSAASTGTARSTGSAGDNRRSNKLRLSDPYLVDSSHDGDIQGVEETHQRDGVVTTSRNDRPEQHAHVRGLDAVTQLRLQGGSVQRGRVHGIGRRVCSDWGRSVIGRVVSIGLGEPRNNDAATEPVASCARVRVRLRPVRPIRRPRLCIQGGALNA